MADALSDLFGSIKKAAKGVESVAVDAWRNVENAAQETGSFVADRFKDTKATRAVDYAARKAAFETALKVSQEVLALAEKTADVTLAGTEKSIQSAVTAGDLFLTEFIQKTSSTVLQGSATAAQGILEGAKQAGVLTLKGSDFIMTQVFGQFDINRLYYENSLKKLAAGVFGNVTCDAVLLGKNVSISFDLDPRDIATVMTSLQPVFMTIEKFFKNNFIKPIQIHRTVLATNKSDVDRALQLAERPLPDTLEKAIAATEKFSNNSFTFTNIEIALLEELTQSTKKLEQIAYKRDEELKKLTVEKGTASVAARHEIVRRNLNKK